jgi:SAM-dependent methyltransferase
MALTLRHRACPICGSDAATVWREARFDIDQLDQMAFASRKPPELMSFRLLNCAACDLVYASPCPMSGWLHSQYEEAGFDSGIEARYAARTYIRVLNRLAPSRERNTALDVGAGNGAFMEELLDAGYREVQGVEPSLAPIEDASPRVRTNIAPRPFDPSAYAPESFDLIACHQTIEHLDDPKVFFEGARRLLRSGGLLYVVAHNFRASAARILKDRCPIYDIEHLQLFSKRSLEDLYRRTGFGDVTITSFANTYPISYWARLFPMPAPARRRTDRLLERSGLGRRAIALPAGNIAAVGRRPHE